MSYSARLATPVHILLAIHRFKSKEKITSTFLVNSIQTDPVIIRNLLERLQKARLVKVRARIGGAHLARQPEDLIFWDIFLVVEDSNKTIFKPHGDTNPNCEVRRVAYSVPDPCLNEIHSQFLQSSRMISLASLITDMDNEIAQDNH